MASGSDTTNDTNTSSKKRWLMFALGLALIVVAFIAAFFIITARSSSELESSIEDSQSSEQSMASETVIPGMDDPVAVPVPEQSEPAQEDSADVGGGRGIYGDDPLSGSSPEEVIGTAREFASVLIETEFTSTEQMREDVTPFLTNALREKFQTVEYYNVPIHTLDGRVSIFSQGTSDALVDVEFADGGFMRVYLVRENDQWKVSDYGLR